jgi:hypothetical protein
MSASSQCPHVDVRFHLNLAAFGDTNLRYLEISGHCQTCDQPVRFRGPHGLSPQHATVSIDGADASVPLTFGDEAYDGKARGYTMKVLR